MKKTFRLAAAAMVASMAMSASAALTTYSQNFEGLDASSPTALSDDGWLVFGNIFDGAWNYLYGYGPDPAPNGTGAFSDIATGEGGPNQMTQYLNAYSDYNSGEHANSDRIIESNVFQEQRIGAADLGQSFVFEFDYKASSTAGPAGDTQTFAWFKVLHPTTFALVSFPMIETTNASTTDWSENNQIILEIDNSWNDHILQFGFLSWSSNYENSGVYYDNIGFAAVPEPATVLLLGAGAAALIRRKRK